jgi:hypothetical protein
MPEHVPILVEQMDTANRDVLLFPVPEQSCISHNQVDYLLTLVALGHEE